MAILIKKIEANLLPHIVGEINALDIGLIIGGDDYFKVFGLEGLIQNFTKVVESEEYTQYNQFGLKRNNKETFTLLEISY